MASLSNRMIEVLEENRIKYFYIGGIEKTFLSKIYRPYGEKTDLTS